MTELKDQRPMICPDCHMIYYRETNKDGWACDFCGSEEIQATTDEHIQQLVKNRLLQI